MRTLLAIFALALAGCATRPAPAAADPVIYRPAQPITYPLPR